MTEPTPNTDTDRQNISPPYQVSSSSNSATAPLLIDLNQADLTTLMTLPGIGEKIADRIIHYRETIRPFQSPVEITTVQGISMSMYQEMADRLTVSPPADSMVEETSTPTPSTPTEATADDDTTNQDSDEGTTDEGYLLMWGHESIENKPTRQEAAKIEPISPSIPPVEDKDGKEPYLVETTQTSDDPINFRRSWLLMVVGALLGAFIALALMYTVNGGTLNIADHPKVIGLENELTALKEREAVLAETIETVRIELGQYETLNTQFQSSKAEIEVLKQSRDDLTGQVSLLEAENKALATQAATLEQQLATVAQQIATLEEDTGRFDSFLGGLRELLVTDSGLAPSVATTPTPTLTPSPTN